MTQFAAARAGSAWTAEKTKEPELTPSGWRSAVASWPAGDREAWFRRALELQPPGATAAQVEQAERWALEDLSGDPPTVGPGPEVIPRAVGSGQPIATPDPPSATTWWRPLIARKPPGARARWGRRANELAESGTPFPEDEQTAFVELFGEPATIPDQKVAPGLDPRGWSADGLSWADSGEPDLNFDPCPLAWPPPPRDRPEEEGDAPPRPYQGR